MRVVLLCRCCKTRRQGFGPWQGAPPLPKMPVIDFFPAACVGSGRIAHVRVSRPANASRAGLRRRRNNRTRNGCAPIRLKLSVGGKWNGAPERPSLCDTVFEIASHATPVLKNYLLAVRCHHDGVARIPNSATLHEQETADAMVGVGSRQSAQVAQTGGGRLEKGDTHRGGIDTSQIAEAKVVAGVTLDSEFLRLKWPRCLEGKCSLFAVQNASTNHVYCMSAPHGSSEARWRVLLISWRGVR